MVHSHNIRHGLFRRGRKHLKAGYRTILIACGLLWLVTAPQAVDAGTTTEVSNFGSNPGHLRMFKYIPDQLSGSVPLIVVMHGCKQTEPTYANEAGWVQMADKLHVMLIMPTQVQANNSNNCFNWFQPANATRDKGEAASIKQMIDKMQSDHNIDLKRIYVTGLSAGGAMTSVMLATYPEVFAGGGIVAGLPYGCAKNPNQGMDVADAMQCMTSGHPLVLSVSATGIPTVPGISATSMPIPPAICLFNPLLCPPPPGSSGFTAAQLGDFVRQASNHTRPFPESVDLARQRRSTVNPVNEKEEMLQWTNVHAASSIPAVQDTVKGVHHEAFKDGSGAVVVETYLISGMSHGVPVDPGTAADQCGTADQFVIDANICSSFFIAKFWGLVS